MQREHWSTSFGFVAAAVGCAVGLGNIWMFPWRLGTYGSLSFLIPYLIFTFGFVVFGLMAELALGRWGQRGTIGVFEKAFSPARRKLARALGGFQILAQTGITVFYFIVTGWILHYLWLALSGGLDGATAGERFGGFVGNPGVLPWHIGAVVLTGAVNLLGVQGGLERLNRWAMPALFILLAALIARSLTLPGAVEGLAGFLAPDWARLFETETWIMALGQSFFTVSLGGMIIYGSYLSRGVNLRRTTYWIVTSNFAASAMAALIILPAAAAFGLDLAAGPGLLFVTMPGIFEQMPAGPLFAVLFFLCVSLAALSSAVNLLEVPVEAVMHVSGRGRTFAVLAVGGLTLAAGVPLALDMAAFGAFVDTVTLYLYPLGVLLIVLVGQWVLGSHTIREEINAGGVSALGPWLEGHLRYVFVAVCLTVIVLNVAYGGL